MSSDFCTLSCVNTYVHTYIHIFVVLARFSMQLKWFVNVFAKPSPDVSKKHTVNQTFVFLQFGFNAPNILGYYTKEITIEEICSPSLFSPPLLPPRELFFNVRSQKLPVLFFGFLSTTFKPLSGPEEESRRLPPDWQPAFKVSPFQVEK